MADSEDLKLLASGEIDLSRCDFRGAKLSGLDLRGRNFSHCLMEKAVCENTRFDGSNFRNASVSFMKANNAVFDGCQLERLHFGYTELSGASFRNVTANGARFQHANLNGANLEGAQLVGGAMDADTKIEGVIINRHTNFEGLQVLRPISRNILFKEYIFENGKLRRRPDVEEFITVDSPIKENDANKFRYQKGRYTEITATKIQNLLRSSVVTRITAQQFATQIEDALREIPASYENKLAEPFQTMLEFADVLRNLAPASSLATDPLDREHLESRIAELENLVDLLTLQLSNEAKAREAAETMLASDGFGANFRRSAGKASGVAAAALATSLVTVGVPTAAVYFLGGEHPIVAGLLDVISSMPK